MDARRWLGVLMIATVLVGLVGVASVVGLLVVERAETAPGATATAAPTATVAPTATPALFTGEALDYLPTLADLPPGYILAQEAMDGPEGLAVVEFRDTAIGERPIMVLYAANLSNSELAAQALFRSMMQEDGIESVFEAVLDGDVQAASRPAEIALADDAVSHVVDLSQSNFPLPGNGTSVAARKRNLVLMVMTISLGDRNEEARLADVEAFLEQQLVRSIRMSPAMAHEVGQPRSEEPAAAPTATRTPIPSPTPRPGSFAAPAGFDERIVLQDMLKNHRIAATLLEARRGAEAEQLAAQLEDYSYTAPIEGQEYLCVRVRLEVLEALDEHETFRLFPYPHLTLRYEKDGSDIWSDLLLGAGTVEGYVPMESETWVFFLIREGSEPLLYFQPFLAVDETFGHRTSGAYFALPAAATP